MCVYNACVWNGWKRILMNILVLIIGLTVGVVLWLKVFAVLFFGRW